MTHTPTSSGVSAEAIPEDIIKAAAECWGSLPKESRGIHHIARAILAERKRTPRPSSDTIGGELADTLRLVRSMRTVESLAPAYQSEVEARREAWNKIDLKIDAALAASPPEGRQDGSAPPVEEETLAAVAVDRNTHLLDWLSDGWTHCQHGTKEWCEAYLHNAREVIKAQDAALSLQGGDKL